MPSILVCCGAVIALLGLPTFAQAQTPPPLQPEILRVSNAADTGEGSLRWAIERSNSAPGHYRIEIDLPGQAPFVIKPASPLPPIKGPVEIEGMAWKRSGDFTAIDGSGYIENKGMQTCPGATPGQYGANVRTLTNPGLTLIDTEGIDISGLEIRYFCIGILIHRSSGNTIHDNHIIGNRGGAGIMLTGDDGNGNSTAITTRYNKIIRNEFIDNGDRACCKSRVATTLSSAMPWGPPPYFHASGISFGQVSEPGSPGAGMVYRRHSFLPVSGSHASRKPRVVRSPPAIPVITTPFATSGAMIPV
jgi:parallel beta-helix repeat protein